MNVWEWAALGYIVALVPPMFLLLSRHVLDRIVVQQFTSIVTSLVVVVLAQAFGQSSYLVVALTLAALSLPSALVYARFFERWL